MSRCVLLIPCLACLLAGCALEPSHPPLGQSVRRAVAAQILDPAAGGTEPVVGLDGAAGQNVLQGYREGFAAQPQQSGGAGLLAVPLGGDKK